MRELTRARVLQAERRAVSGGERARRRERVGGVRGSHRGGVRVCRVIRKRGQASPLRGGAQGVRQERRRGGVRASGLGNRRVLRGRVLRDAEQRVQQRPPAVQTRLLRESAMELGELHARGRGFALPAQPPTDGVRRGVLVRLHRCVQRAAHDAQRVAVDAVDVRLGRVARASPRQSRAHESAHERGGVAVLAPLHGGGGRALDRHGDGTPACVSPGNARESRTPRGGMCAPRWRLRRMRDRSWTGEKV